MTVARANRAVAESARGSGERRIPESTVEFPGWVLPLLATSDRTYILAYAITTGSSSRRSVARVSHPITSSAL